MRKDLPSPLRKRTEPVVSEASPFDALAGKYDAWFDHDGKIIFATEVKALQKILPLLPKPWLEVGVGSGRFAQALGIATGIDPSVKLLTMARKRGITGFLVRGEEEFFHKRTFGTVFLIMTLCFVDSPEAVLEETHRILNNGGKLVLGIVFEDSPWGQFYQNKKEEGHNFYRHATFYRHRDVTELISQTGFIIENVVSTLFQEPDKVEVVELPRDGFLPGAGFTVVIARKVSTKSPKTHNWSHKI